jgi:hypothetical protein
MRLMTLILILAAVPALAGPPQDMLAGQLRPYDYDHDRAVPGDPPCGPMCPGGCYREDQLEAARCNGCGCSATARARAKTPARPRLAPARVQTVKVVRRAIPQAPTAWSNDDLIAARVASLGPTAPQVPYVPSAVWFPPAPVGWVHTQPTIIPSYTAPAYRTVRRGPYNGGGYGYGAACDPNGGPNGCATAPAARGGFPRLFDGGFR